MFVKRLEERTVGISTMKLLSSEVTLRTSLFRTWWLGAKSGYFIHEVERPKQTFDKMKLKQFPKQSFRLLGCCLMEGCEGPKIGVFYF